MVFHPESFPEAPESAPAFQSSVPALLGSFSGTSVSDAFSRAVKLRRGLAFVRLVQWEIACCRKDRPLYSFDLKIRIPLYL